MSNNKYTRLLKNTGIVFVGNVGSKLLLFLMLPFYTRHLSPCEYGISDLIVVYSTILLGIVTCQIQDAVFVFPKGESKERQISYFTSGLVFLCGVYAALGCLVPLLKIVLPMGSFIHDYCGLMVAYLALAGFNQYFQQFCRATDHMYSYAFSGLGLTVIVVGLSLWLIPRFPSGRVLGFVQCIGFVGGCAIVVFAAHLWEYVRIRCFSRANLMSLLKYSLPLVPTAVMWWMLSSLNRPLLERYCSFAAVGFYAAAIKLPALLNVAWSVIGNAWQISVLEEYHKANFVRYFWSFFAILALGVLVVVVVLSFAAPFVMRYLVAPAFYSVYRYVPVLSVGAGLSMLAGVFGALFAASKKSRYFLFSSLWAVGSIVAFNFLLIPQYGIWGAAFANVLAMGVELLVRTYYGCQILRRLSK